MESDSTHPDDVRAEVARRLDRMTSTPGAILRWDRDGDGVVDAEEYALMRSVIEREVIADLEFAHLADEPTDEIVDEWEPDEEVIDPHAGLPVIEVIDGRYNVIERLGHGSQGTTYLARTAHGELVALKELRFQGVDSWKSIDLFEREAKALAALEHDRIPSFVESFQVEREDGVRFFMAQQFVGGDSLDVLLARGELFGAHAARQLARSVLEVLDYLHRLNPPVVHRDIKPANLIRREDGSYAVVDFGAVQLVMANEVGGSTVVGTTGYMPTEQLAGRAIPQSDLYALGATLAHVLTGEHPADLPTERLKLAWRDESTADGPLAELVDRLVEPMPEDRPDSALAALEALGGAPLVAAAVVDGDARALAGRSAVRLDALVERSDYLTYDEDRLIVDVPWISRSTTWLLPAGVVCMGGGLLVAGIMGLVGGMVVAIGVCLALVLIMDAGGDTLTVRRTGAFEIRVPQEDEPDRVTTGVLATARSNDRGKGLLLEQVGGIEIRHAEWMSPEDAEMVADAIRELLRQ